MPELDALERRIAEELGLMGGSPTGVEATLVARAVAAQAPRRRSRITLIAASLAAAIGAVAVLATLLVVSGVIRIGDDEVGEGPVATARPTAMPTTRAVPLTLRRTWARLTLPSLEGAPSADLAVGPGGAILVVTGGDGGVARPVGWLTDDRGRTWTRTRLGLRSEDVARVSSVTTFAGRFIAVGHDASGGFVLASDDGLRWERIASLGRTEPLEVRATPDGLIARGTQRSGGARDARLHPVALASSDATTWAIERIATVGSSRRDARPTDLQTSAIARSADGVTVVPGLHLRGGIERAPPGSVLADVGVEEAIGLYWRSEDGSTWTPMPLPRPAGSIDAPGDVVRAVDVAWAAEAGFVMSLQAPGPAIGSRSGTLWRSDDAIAWEPVEDTGRAVATEILTDGRELIAFTTPVAERNSDGDWLVANAPARELASRDGVTWRPFEDPLFLRLDVRQAALAPDGAVLALGFERIPGEREVKVDPAWQLLIGDPR